MSNNLKYATLAAGSRWLLKLTALGTAAGEVTAADLEMADQFAYVTIKNRMAAHFDTTNWKTNTPVEISTAAEAIAAAFVIKFRMAQDPSVAKQMQEPWKLAHDFGNELLKGAIANRRVTLPDDTDQIARHGATPQASQPPAFPGA